MNGKKTKTYKEIKAELDDIIIKLGEDIDIEDAIEKYEKATVMIAELEKILKRTKLKINKL